MVNNIGSQPYFTVGGLMEEIKEALQMKPEEKKAEEKPAKKK